MFYVSKLYLLQFSNAGKNFLFFLVPYLLNLKKDLLKFVYTNLTFLWRPGPGLEPGTTGSTVLRSTPELSGPALDKMLPLFKMFLLIAKG